jgi:hypothetical protein
MSPSETKDVGFFCKARLASPVEALMTKTGGARQTHIFLEGARAAAAGKTLWTRMTFKLFLPDFIPKVNIILRYSAAGCAVSTRILRKSSRANLEPGRYKEGSHHDKTETFKFDTVYHCM